VSQADLLADQQLPMEEQRFPSFHKMVEYYYVKGSQVIESKLAAEVKGRMSKEEKMNWIRGILRFIQV